MACRLVGAEPFFETMLEYFNSNLKKKFKWNLKQNSYILIQENAFENDICEMAANVSRPQCVK